MKRLCLLLLLIAGCDFSATPATAPGSGFGEDAARYVETDLPEDTDQLCRVLDAAAKVEKVEFSSAKVFPEFQSANQPLTDAMRKEAAARLRGGK